MQVTIHASAQTEPFIVKARRFEVPSQGKWCLALDIRQPSEGINDGIGFILRDAAQFRALILQLVDEAERMQAEERADFDRVLKAKVHAVLDRKVAERLRGVAPAPAPDENPNERMYAAAKAEAR